MKKLLLVYLLLLSGYLFAQPGNVLSFKKYTYTSKNFGSVNYALGSMVTSIGDLNKDGNKDLFVTVYQDGGNYRASFYVLFLDKSGEILSSTNFSPGINGFPLIPGFSYTAFGSNTYLGDLNGDGGADIAIGNSGDAGGLVNIVSLGEDGKIEKITVISAGDVNPNGNSAFGARVASVGDINGDGVNDLAVGAYADNDGGSQKGAVYIIFLNAKGEMKNYQKISSLQGGFQGIYNGYFGISIASIGDINKDSVQDVIVGSGTSDSNDDHWVLFLNKSGQVIKHQKLAVDSGGFDFTLKPDIGFSRPINTGDIDGDGINEIFISAVFDTTMGKVCGSSRILFMDTTGRVKYSKLTDYSSFMSDFGNGDRASVTDAGFDVNGDYKNDFILGVPYNDFGGTNKGIFYMVLMDGAIHPVQPQSRFTAKDTSGLTTKIFTFTNTSAGYPKQVKWSFTPNTVTYQNGTTDTSLDSVQVKFTAAGTYSVKLWVQNPFGQDSLLKTNHIVVNPIGGFDELRSNPFSVYPVPATTALMVSGGEDLNGAVTLSIQNCIGETLSTETRLFTSNIPQVLNTSELPQGLYFLSISHNNIQYSLKFIK